MTDGETWGNNGGGKETVRGREKDRKRNGVRNWEVDSFHGAQRSEVE